ncbi:MAG: hypothetical protein ABR586_06490 [Thermoplasmatota archaeon]
MNLANALPCLLLLVLLVPPASADGVAVRAPPFTLTGTYTIPLPPDARNATLTLDTGQSTHVAGPAAVVSIAGVPDGGRTWSLTFQDPSGPQTLTGEFVAQDLTPIIAAQVNRAVAASLAAQQAAEGAQATAAEAVNASQVQKQTEASILAAVQAIHVPDDLSRRADVEHVGATVAAQGAAVGVVLHEAAANQTAALQDARHELRSLRDAGAFVLGLLLLGLGLLACYLVKLRAELRALPDRRPKAPAKPARSARLPPAPRSPAPRRSKRSRGLAGSLTDPGGGPDAD